MRCPAPCVSMYYVVQDLYILTVFLSPNVQHGTIRYSNGWLHRAAACISWPSRYFCAVSFFSRLEDIPPRHGCSIVAYPTSSTCRFRHCRARSPLPSHGLICRFAGFRKLNFRLLALIEDKLNDVEVDFNAQCCIKQSISRTVRMRLSEQTVARSVNASLRLVHCAQLQETDFG